MRQTARFYYRIADDLHFGGIATTEEELNVMPDKLAEQLKAMLDKTEPSYRD
ncbi:MAG: hypothetical protein ACI9CE_001998 [Flavobacterium sp.]|jgi:hypothetical protein